MERMISVNNTGATQHILANTSIKHYGTDTLLCYLPENHVEIVHGVSSFSQMWDSTGSEPGWYYFESVIRNESGCYLAKATTYMRLGRSNLELRSYSVSPSHLHPGDDVHITLDIFNNGSMAVNGTWILRVKEKGPVSYTHLTLPTN